MLAAATNKDNNNNNSNNKYSNNVNNNTNNNAFQLMMSLVRAGQVLSLLSSLRELQLPSSN